MVKRIFDIIVALCVLLAASPVILIGTLAVKLTSPGPAFYRSKRAGLGGKLFFLFKLRTMRVGSATDDRRITDIRDDRITAVGTWLRRFKIDELPQFWNVLRGDLSIVGPRPEDWDIVEQHYTDEQRRTLSVRPGITSPAQVRWYPDLTYHDPPPDGTPIQEYYLRRHLPAKLEEELRYVDQHNTLRDLRIILQTAYCIAIPHRISPRLSSRNHRRRATSECRVTQRLKAGDVILPSVLDPPVTHCEWVGKIASRSIAPGSTLSLDVVLPFFESELLPMHQFRSFDQLVELDQFVFDELGTAYADAAWTAGNFNYVLPGKAELSFVAVRSFQVLGFWIASERVQGEAHTHRVAIRPACRDGSTARRLFCAFWRATLTRPSVRRMTVEVGANNEHAQEFYVSLGYRMANPAETRSYLQTRGRNEATCDNEIISDRGARSLVMLRDIEKRN